MAKVKLQNGYKDYNLETKFYSSTLFTIDVALVKSEISVFKASAIKKKKI